MTAAQTKKPQKQQQPQQPRPPAPKLRMIVRRLPPGLIEAEFWEAIGPEWKVGGGKLDWAAFRPGKISKDLAKPSRPSRAYLKVKEQSLIEPLSIHIRATVFQDAKNSARDSCLVGPPVLEFAPYPKIPGTRIRHDGRQGTIDQDSEFIDFLQSLTEPITKPAADDSAENRHEKVSITPLVQFIKDKKASKAKEKEAAAASSKSAKKPAEDKDVKDAKGTKDSKNATPSKSETVVVKKGAQTEVEKARVAKATQQAMDSIKKSVAEIKGQPSSKESKNAEKKDTTPTQPSAKKERQRGDASAAARIIGRDLGLVPKEGRAPRGQRAVTTPAQQSAATPPTAPAAARTPPQTPIPTAPAADKAQGKPNPQPPTGPRNLRNQNNQPSPLRANQTPPVPKGKPPPQPSNGAKSAFLKHANPSQGVTEELLRSTFSVHGTITRCEIDKKKGLGYIDFTDTDGLRKALAASPVKVGNGSVVVLENRTPYKKVSQGSARNGTPSPSVSIPSSPKILQSNLATIAERSATPPVPTIATPAASDVVSPTPNTTEVSQVETKATEVLTPSITTEAAAQDFNQANTTEEVVPTSPTSATPPSAPRGGRGNHRGHYRGRGYRGRGQPRGGGNKAANTPNSNGDTSSSAQTAPPAAGGIKN